MDLGLGGARALIGGGSSGLGLAVGTALGGEGARVALAARPSDRLDAAAAAVEGSVAVGVDLESGDGPATAVARAVETLGGLDAAPGQLGRPTAWRVRCPRRGDMGPGDRGHALRSASVSSARHCRTSATAIGRRSW